MCLLDCWYDFDNTDIDDAFGDEYDDDYDYDYDENKEKNLTS